MFSSSLIFYSLFSCRYVEVVPVYKLNKLGGGFKERILSAPNPRSGELCFRSKFSVADETPFHLKRGVFPALIQSDPPGVFVDFARLS